MAANEYYNSSSHTANSHHIEPTPHLPQDSFTAYKPYSAQHSSPYASPTREDSSYRPYEPSQNSSSTNYYASGGGGREHDQNSFSDDIPLRQNPSKADSETAFQDHLPHDPTVVDTPPERGIKERTRRKKGFFSGKIPWVVYTFTLIQCIVFIAELAKNGKLTGSPIEIHPNFNPTIGPSPYVLINMGARFVPCMRATSQGLDTEIPWPCPNATDITDSSSFCALNQLCGFNDGPYSDDHPPRQWYRFIIPMFLHGGFIHIAFNMLVQILLGREIEISIGSIRFFFVYLSSGIFGFVLGGNFAPEGIASTGASGSLFGIIAIMLLDLIYHWEERQNPWSDLTWIIVCIIISLVLGLLPGLDNFSHIGGFLMGLVLGVCILHSPDVLRRRAGADLPPYTSVQKQRRALDTGGIIGFVKEPVGFFKGRKVLWWAWWLVRAAALIGVLAGFIVLLQNFYKANPTKCHWCRYLSCINIKNWCDAGQLQTTNTTKAMLLKRSMFDGTLPVLVDELAQ